MSDASVLSDGCVSPVSPDMDYKSVVTEDEAVCPEGFKKVFISQLSDGSSMSVMPRPSETIRIVFYVSFFDRKSGTVGINRVSGTFDGSVSHRPDPVSRVTFWTSSTDFDGIVFESRVRADFWVYVPIETELPLKRW